ncbi:MAG TPA: nitrilase-related carbon-nitrogen hydrolase [Streptosporangiaceae bacterium]|nr:nitrilase-related carbon-nitrogen hydrolase [Streptosporangiaceae bacterium]
MDPTKIAVAQLAITVAEPDANRQAAADAVTAAAEAGARLVVLPELCDSGYVFAPEDPAAEARGLAAPAAGNPTLRQWHALAGRHGLVIVGGFCELGDDGRLYNSAAIVDASGIRVVYRKAHLWDTEKLVFTPGDAAPPVVGTEAGRVGLMVCYDLEFPEWTRLAALDGADLIAAPVNWPGYAWEEGERPAEVVKAQATAAANGVFVAVADRCRTERGVSWVSGSLIASPDGYLLAGPVLADRPALLTAECDLPRARNKRVSERNDLLADRRPELYAWAPDKRVAAARAHWAARFVANGTSYPDFEATLARIGRWDDWCREWGRTARHYEQVAEAAEAAVSAVTAGEAWRRAALCWHWGKFVFTDHPEEQRAAHERTVACFRRGAGALSPPAEPARVPYGGTTLAAYLRVPRAAGGGRPPIVIMIPGLDSVKEELQATAGYLLGRGLAVIAVDGPGQGETEYELPIEPAYERVTTAVADYLKGRDDIDPDRIGVFGVSLGGYYAARSAAYEPRVRAVVDLAGPYRFDLDWDTLAPQTRTTFQHRSGTASAAQARERAAALTLEDAAPRITCPLLVVHGGRDRLIPAYHAERLAREAPGAELLLYPDGSHGVTNHAFESRAAIADWLAAHL